LLNNEKKSIASQVVSGTFGINGPYDLLGLMILLRNTAQVRWMGCFYSGG